MALTPLSASSPIQSTSNDIPTDIPRNYSDLLPTMPFVSDAALNKYAIDTGTYADTTKQLLGFTKGHRVSVTYYRILNREGTNNRTNIADTPSSRNVIDAEYQKILMMELTLPKGFDFTVNQEKANMSMKGSALFYPGINPNIGDIFLMGVGDGRIGVCRVSDVAPTSWRQDRGYTADFFVQEFQDDSNHDPLEGSVTITSVFDKTNYFGSTSSLLSEQTYLALQKIRTMRSNLCKMYHQKFFDADVCSYMHPDGIYDPWVVQFMSNKITMADVPIRAKNMYGKNPQNYQKTLWARLEDRYNTSMYLLSPYMNRIAYNQTRTGVFISELYNRSILFPYDTGDPENTYIYSEAFYKGQKELMTPEELMVYNVVTLRTTGDLNMFITQYLDLVPILSDTDQFYKIPLYIHLIDVSLQSKYRESDAPSMSYSPNGSKDV